MIILRNKGRLVDNFGEDWSIYPFFPLSSTLKLAIGNFLSNILLKHY
jgi:hypothetical protein